MKPEEIIENEENIDVQELDTEQKENAEQSLKSEADKYIEIIEKLEAERQKYKDDYLRAYAEMENIRKRSIQEIEKTAKFWDLEPGNDLLSNREENEAYLASKPGKSYVLFFTDGGEVGLDLTKFEKEFNVKWFDIRKGKLISESKITGGKIVNLKVPGELEWLALIKMQE